MRAMTERTRVVVLILIMAIGILLVTGTTIRILYGVAFAEERARLVVSAQSQARLIEAIAREEATHGFEYPEGVEEVVLDQIVDAHQGYEGFGKTGEFTLALREGDLIVFVLRHRFGGVEQPEPVLFDSGLAEPMRRALSGQSGTVVGLDYRGEMVLAAHEPVAGLGLGIVAKIDVVEVRAPYWRAGVLAGAIALFVVLAGSILLARVSSPMILQLEERSGHLEQVVAALAESEERYREIFELAAVGIAHVSLDGRFIRVNRQLAAIVGYTPDEMLQLRIQEITHPDDLEANLEHVGSVLDGEGDRFSLEKRYMRKDGSSVWVNLTVSLARDESRNPRHFIAVVEDITRRKHAERTVKDSLREKEVLLREIHHRVKNNMQVISSLLNLQSRSIEDPRLRKMFLESQSRVRAMALIHEVLYRSDDLSRIDLEDYVSKLADNLVRMYGADPGRIRLEVAAQQVTLGIDDTVPCGLVISELLSNSLKYAFPDDRSGEISIHAMATDDDRIVLTVRDNGVGIPDDVDIRDTETMGMGLVTGLVENQLGGQLELDRVGGAGFTIVFPRESARRAG
jgi:PAS domain S-box-containing protein